MKAKQTILILSLGTVLLLTACGGSKDKSFTGSMLQSLIDSGAELKEPRDIEEVMFRSIGNPWSVEEKSNDNLAKRIKNLIIHKAFPATSTIAITKAFYNFEYDYNIKYYTLKIRAYCKIDGEDRVMVIDCGKSIITYLKVLKLSNKWYVSLYDTNNEMLKEKDSWHNCYYSSKDMDRGFKESQVMYASKNRIIMDNGICLEPGR